MGRKPHDYGEPVRPPRAVTIHDVARAAGVGISTVSRAFSNPGRVNAVTREHVLTVANQVGYRPNPVARALESGRRRTVALVVPDMTNPHHFGLIRGVEREAASADYTVVLGDSEQLPQTEQAVIERLRPVVDGFVLAASRLSGKAIRELNESVPLVLMNRELTGIGSVITDHGEGTRQIVEHLASLGHRTIAFLSGPLNSWSGARRWSALEAAARRLRLEAPRLGPFTPSIDGGAAAADAAIASGATGIVAFNDLLALGVLRRLSERGVEVPGQLSLVGYDDIFGADLSSPALTTLAGPIEEAGRTALAQLLRLIDQPSRKPQRTVLPSHLVIRDSTAPPASTTTATG